MKIIVRNFLKWFLLSFVMFALANLDFYRLELVELSLDSLIWRGLMAMIDSMILCLVVEKSRKQGFRLMVVLFLALFGTKTVLTVVEATYLPMLRPMVAPLLVNGIIASSLSIMIAVLVCNTGYTESPDEKQSMINWHKPWYQWLWQFLAVAFIWMMLFVGFGAFVFLNVAKIFDPQALATYSNLGMPAWVLPFQGLRALLWIGLTLPLVTQLNGSKVNVASLVGCLFAGWIGSNLLLALDLPAGLRLAHLLEVGGESFVFGFMMVLIFARKGISEKESVTEYRKI